MTEQLPRVRFEKHHGKPILVMDYSHIEDFDLIYKALEEGKAFCANLPPKSALALTDVTDSSYDTKIVEALKEAATHNAAYIKASAVIGVTGLIKAILPVISKFSGRKYKAFNTREEAMEWLVSQDQSRKLSKYV